jgi:large subunit ribosomal protein L35
MDYKIINQRISQFYIVPDVLPKLEPIVDVKLFWRQEKISPGTILNSRLTETAPTLHLQSFEPGERLYTVVVVDADVPVAEEDTFARRCHFMAANIPWDPTKKSLPLSRITTAGGVVAVPWLPPTSQKGAPYHRLGIFVLEQQGKKKAAETASESDGAVVALDAANLTTLYDGPGRESFSLDGFRHKFGLKPVGFTMFRTVWDENTADVMARHGIPGADIEFRRPRIHSLKPPRKPKGWEAKRQKPKYKHLWKYTKRIAS